MSDWPTGLTLRPISTWPGEMTKNRRHADFKVKVEGSWDRKPTPLYQTLDLLQRELDQLKAKNVVLEIALREQDFRVTDGMPRATAKAAHPGVILSFDSKHGPLRYPCDTFLRWQDNLRGIALALEALRKVERYGVTKRAEQYRGWQQIEGTPSGERPMDREMARAILDDIVPGYQTSTDGWDQIVRRAKAAAHPDRHNGDRRLWDNVEQAARVLGLAS